MSNPNPLELAASADRLRLLAQKKLLGEQDLSRALKLAGYYPDATAWAGFINYTLLLMGVAFALSGVFFFFAYNWADLPRFAKFGVIEAGIIVAAGLAFYQGLARLPGRVALLVAALLVGVLLAVYGQTYQTGADAYQLFLTWAGLITGWTLISAFGPLWFSWLVLLNLSLFLYGQQMGGQDETILFELLFLLNGTALLAWEYGHRRGLAWLKSRWIPRLTALMVFIALSWPVFNFIDAFQNGYIEGVVLFLAPVLYVGFFLLVGWLYLTQINDLFILTIAALSLIAVVTYLLVQFVDFLTDDAFGFLLLGFLVMAQAAIAVIGLRWVAGRWERISP